MQAEVLMAASTVSESDEVANRVAILKQAHAQSTLKGLKLLVIPESVSLPPNLNSVVISFGEFIVGLQLNLNLQLERNFVVIRHNATEAERFKPLKPTGVPPAMFFYPESIFMYEEASNVWMVMKSDRYNCGKLLIDQDLLDLPSQQ